MWVCGVGGELGDFEGFVVWCDGKYLDLWDVFFVVYKCDVVVVWMLYCVGCVVFVVGELVCFVDVVEWYYLEMCVIGVLVWLIVFFVDVMDGVNDVVVVGRKCG